MLVSPLLRNALKFDYEFPICGASKMTLWALWSVYGPISQSTIVEYPGSMWPEFRGLATPPAFALSSGS